MMKALLLYCGNRPLAVVIFVRFPVYTSKIITIIAYKGPDFFPSSIGLVTHI